MIVHIIAILSMMFISLFIEKKIKVPNALTLMVLTFGMVFVNPTFFEFTNMSLFSDMTLSFVVILVLVDAFIISYEELKENWLSILYMVTVGIILSILSGIFALNYVFSEYDLTAGAMIVLLAMCIATDPVLVVSVFKQFKVPHKIKLLAEAESLFNDPIALIAAFAFGVYMMQGNVLTTEYAITISIKMIGISLIIGLITGIIGLLLMKLTKDTMLELLLLIIVAYSAFEGAELFHASGLLAEIIAIVTMTKIISESYKKEVIRINAYKSELTKKSIPHGGSSNFIKENINNLMIDITDVKRQDNIFEFLTVIAMFVQAMLFISLAKIMNFDNMFIYWKEILIMFLLTTFIRVGIMSKFAITSNVITKMTNIDLKSFFVLLFSGIKGGLSIVMLHMFNQMVPDYKYFDMFVAVVSGVILLSMFLYVLGLVITINLNKEAFEKEIEEEEKLHGVGH